MNETAMKTANKNLAVVKKSPSIQKGFDGETTMTIAPVPKAVKENMITFPRTWRWVRWHSAWIVLAGLGYLFVSVVHP